MDDAEYKKNFDLGFKQGYLLARYTPWMDRSYFMRFKDDAFVEGFVEGQLDWEQTLEEMSRSPLTPPEEPYWLEKVRSIKDLSGNDKGNEIDKDKEQDK